MDNNYKFAVSSLAHLDNSKLQEANFHSLSLNLHLAIAERVDAKINTFTAYQLYQIAIGFCKEHILTTCDKMVLEKQLRKSLFLLYHDKIIFVFPNYCRYAEAYLQDACKYTSSKYSFNFKVWCD